MSQTKRPVTLRTLAAKKERGEPISMLTAYDASFARQLEQAGVDCLLVGDSLGNVIQGHTTTLPVGLDDMVYHTRAVSRGVQRAFVIADMPFMSYPDPATAARSAHRLMAEGRAGMVKLEGGGPVGDSVAHLHALGVPVCAHLGLTPQHIHRLGGFRVQGRAAPAAEAMLEDARALESAGAQMLVLECVPAHVAASISAELTIPVIGIGAGAEVDGQVLVLYDMLGISDRAPRFARDFLTETGSVRAAAEAYVEAVGTRRFPAAEHCFD